MPASKPDVILIFMVLIFVGTAMILVAMLFSMHVKVDKAADRIIKAIEGREGKKEEKL